MKESFLLTNKMHDTIHTVHITHSAHSEKGTEGAIYRKVSLRSKDIKFLHLNKMAKEAAHVQYIQYILNVEPCEQKVLSRS